MHFTLRVLFWGWRALVTGGRRVGRVATATGNPEARGGGATGRGLGRVARERFPCGARAKVLDGPCSR